MLGLAALITALTACGSAESPTSLLEISPASPEVAPGDNVQFTATTPAAPGEPIAWAVVEPTGGTIDRAGVYTAPGEEGTYTVTASLTSLSTTQATQVRVKRNIRVDLSPSAATLAAGESLALTAAVTGSVKTLTWSVAEGTAGGSVTAAGVYTTPGTAGVYTVVATSTADPTKSGTATITVTAAPPPPPPASVTISISPTTASLAGGNTVQFTASVSGSTNVGVTWSVAESGGGSVSATGLYTAPATAGTYHVLATSQADISKTSAATVTVTAPVAPPPTGTQFFVATNGNDANPGTEAQPWRTIQKAMNSATPGSTVNIRGGTYNERLVLNVSGTATQRITFQNYGFAPAGTAPGSGALGEAVILDYAYLGTITDVVPLLDILDKAYVTIQGLTFQNANYNGAGPQWGIRCHGTGTTGIHFKHNKVINLIETEVGVTAVQGFMLHGGAHDNWVYSNEFGNIRPVYAEVFTVAGAPNNLIENNYYRDVYNIACNIFVGPNYPTAGGGNIVRGNLFEYIGFTRTGAVLTAANFPVASTAIYVDGGYNVIIEGNTIRNANVGINVEAESGNSWAAHDVVIRNNLIYRTSTFTPATDTVGIKVGTYYSNTDGTRVYDVDVLNNTIDRVSHAIHVRPYQSSTVKWRNNIVTNAGRYALYNDTSWPVGTMSNNLWFNNPAGTNGSGTGDVFSDPQYTSPGAGNFSISTVSPAREAGNTATTANNGFYSASSMNAGTVDYARNTRIKGTIDIGAHEVQ